MNASSKAEAICLVPIAETPPLEFVQYTGTGKHKIHTPFMSSYRCFLSSASWGLAQGSETADSLLTAALVPYNGILWFYNFAFHVKPFLIYLFHSTRNSR